MKIIDVTKDWFRGELISKTYIFEDDTSVSIDLGLNVIDMDGMYTVPLKKIKSIEKLIGNSIQP